MAVPTHYDYAACAMMLSSTCSEESKGRLSPKDRYRPRVKPTLRPYRNTNTARPRHQKSQHARDISILVIEYRPPIAHGSTVHPILYMPVFQAPTPESCVDLSIHVPHAVPTGPSFAKQPWTTYSRKPCDDTRSRGEERENQGTLTSATNATATTPSHRSYGRCNPCDRTSKTGRKAPIAVTLTNYGKLNQK